MTQCRAPASRTPASRTSAAGPCCGWRRGPPGAAAPGAFDGPADFVANSVFGLPALGSIPLRIDCGYDDPFSAATDEFIAGLPNPPAGGFSPGGHDGGFWSSQLPAEIAWLAPLLMA